MEVEFIVNNDTYREYEEMWRKSNPSSILDFNYSGEQFRFYLPLKNDVIQSYMIYNRTFYELAQLEELCQFIKDSGINISTIVDAGANIGNHTVYLANALDTVYIHSFEPYKPAYDILNNNLLLNHLSVIDTYNFGLGDNDMPAKVFHTNSVHEKNNIGNTKVMQCPDGDIEMRTLDSVEISTKVDFMKIDVEGFEAHVILGAKETILRDKPLIWVESFPENFTMTNYILETFGYEIVKVMGEANYIYQFKNS